MICGKTVRLEKVINQLLLYRGVMFVVLGAVSGVRVLSTQIAKTTLKKLPKKDLDKFFGIHHKAERKDYWG